MTQRLDALRAALDKDNLDGLLITNLINVRYLCGFTGTAGIVLLTPQHAVFFSDGRYREQAQAQVEGCEIEIVVGARVMPRVAERIQALGIRRLGVEATNLTLDQHDSLADLLGEVELTRTKGLVEALRQVKSPNEIDLLRRAAAINDRVVEIACESLREGVSEQDVARVIRDAVEALGGEALAFDTIALFGARSSLPHGMPGDTKLAYGDIVLMDFGARVAGYHGDITRTVVFGEPPDHFEERYAAVLAAQQAVTDNIRPGMSGEQADDLARRILADAGYADAFMHGTGHGVGLEIHEDPRVSPTAENLLAAGHVFTNEPGVYLPGWGGIRIEDMLLLTEHGAQRLTQAPLALRVV